MKFLRCFAGFLAALASMSPAEGSAGGDGGAMLSLPIACVLGENCWIPNYVDHKPGKGVLDYKCGDATYDAPPQNVHKGTDFAIRDMEAMRRGVAVQAAAPGIVIATRDGMADVNFNDVRPSFIKNRECGNAVRIKHANGMITQYCHMRRGSVTVKKGDRVKQGQHLGHVGLSGLTMFPHLHFQVEINKAVLDPFAGLNRVKKCGIGKRPLWDEKTLAALPYQPTAIYHTGFSSKPPDAKKMREGFYQDQRIKIKARAIILWADIFNVKKDDELIFEITDPKSNIIMEKRMRADKNYARYFLYSGAPRKKPVWWPGTYIGKITLLRKGLKDEEFAVTNTVFVR